MDELVSTEWLARQLGEPGLVVLDASAHLPDARRDARAEFAAAHIPGARYLDLDGLKDPTSPVPAALPTAEQFAARMSALGIGNGDRVVIYDDSAVRTSARAWFIGRLHGLDVAILDGGLGKWRAEGRPLESGDPAPGSGQFVPRAGDGAVRTKADIAANLSSGSEQLVDARGAGRFTGAEPEIRPGMPSGHIPGSRNLPFAGVLKADGTFKDEAGLRAAFADAGIDLDRPVVTTCGSGVTAAVLLFAMHLLGKRDVALYDGSWSEWGADPATPKATGPAGAAAKDRQA
jgi:thiosulfate/3-mercaptopyruvate sulfurtransferase